MLPLAGGAPGARPSSTGAAAPRARARRVRRLRRLLDGQEELELRRQLLLGVEAVREVDAADAAVGVDLHPQRLDVVRSWGEEGQGGGGRREKRVNW